NGRLIGALTAKLNLRAVQQIIRRFATNGLGGIVVVTADGTLLASSGAGGAAPMTVQLPAESVRLLSDRAGSAQRYLGFDGEEGREFEHRSLTDDLTGLYNRRYLMETLANEIRRSRRLEHCCALLMADIDHFKEYNDAFGHLAGDEMLIKVARALHESTREVD